DLRLAAVHRRAAVQTCHARRHVALRQRIRDDRANAQCTDARHPLASFHAFTPPRLHPCFLNTISHTPCPSFRPRRSNFVSGRVGGRGANPPAVFSRPCVAESTASTCSAYSCQSVATCSVPPGARREAASD